MNDDNDTAQTWRKLIVVSSTTTTTSSSSSGRRGDENDGRLELGRGPSRHDDEQ